MGGFGGKETKNSSQEGHQNRKFVGNEKQEEERKALRFSSNENLSFQMVLNDSKFARTKPWQKEWIFSKVVLFLFIWRCCCPRLA